MTSAGLPYGLQAMLKEGHRHFAGVDEAVLRNIEASKAIAACCASSMGPNGECFFVCGWCRVWRAQP
jgi:T-complex protein 1 subunit theta